MAGFQTFGRGRICPFANSNRSALHWIIDGYEVRREHDGTVVSDPNRNEDPGYIVRLFGQVVRVAVETQKVIASLSAVSFAQPAQLG